MKLSLKTPLCALIALGVCALAMGCVQRECTDAEREAAGADENDDCSKFVPLRTFTASDTDEREIEWSSGIDLKIRGDVRAVSIVEGDADDSVSVSYKAQVDLAEDRSDEVVRKTMSHLTPKLSLNGNTIEVSANRGDTESNLGAVIVVQLPSTFDSNLVIDKTTSLPGDVSLKFLGGTRQLVVDMNGLGADLNVTDATGVQRATINTRGDIGTGAFAALQAAVIHTSHGDIFATIGNVPESHAKLVADFGEISLTLPSDGDFSLRASADQGVSSGNAPEGCISSQVPSPKLMKCNDGDPDGVTFELEASQEILLKFE